MGKVRVTIYGAKRQGSEEVGIAVLKVKYPPEIAVGKKHKRARRLFADGVAAGVAQCMEAVQPEGDGFPSWPQS